MTFTPIHFAELEAHRAELHAMVDAAIDRLMAAGPAQCRELQRNLVCAVCIHPSIHPFIHSSTHSLQSTQQSTLQIADHISSDSRWRRCKRQWSASPSCTHDATVLAMHGTVLRGVAQRVAATPPTQPRGATHVAMVVKTDGVKAALSEMGHVTVSKAVCAEQCTVAAAPASVGCNAAVELVVEMR